MLAKPLILFSASLLYAANCVPVNPPQYGRVNIEAVNLIGNPIRNLTIELIPLGRPAAQSLDFEGAVATRVPYGAYRMRVGAPAYQPAEREIRVAQANTAIRLELPLPRECENYATILGNAKLGNVKPAVGPGNLWVKAIPVFGTGGSEAPIAADGTFRIAGLDDGNYLLMVLDGSTILYTETLAKVSGNRQVTLDLRPRILPHRCCYINFALLILIFALASPVMR